MIHGPVSNSLRGGFVPCPLDGIDPPDVFLVENFAIPFLNHLGAKKGLKAQYAEVMSMG